MDSLECKFRLSKSTKKKYLTDKTNHLEHCEEELEVVELYLAAELEEGYVLLLEEVRVAGLRCSEWQGCTVC